MAVVTGHRRARSAARELGAVTPRATRPRTARPRPVRPGTARSGTARSRTARPGPAGRRADIGVPHHGRAGSAHPSSAHAVRTAPPIPSLPHRSPLRDDRRSPGNSGAPYSRAQEGIECLLESQPIGAYNNSFGHAQYRPGRWSMTSSLRRSHPQSDSSRDLAHAVQLAAITPRSELSVHPRAPTAAPPRSGATNPQVGAGPRRAGRGARRSVVARTRPNGLSPGPRPFVSATTREKNANNSTAHGRVSTDRRVGRDQTGRRSTAGRLPSPYGCHRTGGLGAHEPLTVDARSPR